MSAELLREAAAKARRIGTAPAALGPNYNDPRHIAVADWLDSEDTHQFGPTEHAINVARAYLGLDS